MLIGSIQARLTLTALLLLLLILGGGGHFWFQEQEQSLLNEYDEGLLAVVEDLTRLHGEALFFRSKMPGCELIDQFVRRRGAREALGVYSLRGELICATDNPASELLSIHQNALSASASGGSFFSTQNDQSENSLRILTYPIFQRSQVSYLVQVAGSLLPVEQHLMSLRMRLILAISAALLFFGVTQWIMTGRQLAPLKRLQQDMAQIDGEHLKSTFRANGGGAEFAQLQQAYEAMLQRLGSAMARARQFTADATHELRTPLTILRGETEVGLRWGKSEEEVKDVLASNLDEIDRMGRIIEDLLLLSKSEVGEMPLQLEPLNLCDLLHELYGQTKLLAESKGIAVFYQAPEQGISLLADGLRLHQLFLNLLSNAVKYTPSGGKVTLSVVQQGDYAQVMVADSGIGIDEKHLKRIFDRFYRIDKARNRGDGGSGLGLSIASWVADAHGGKIEVSSIPGQGSTFTVVLPLLRQQDESTQTQLS